MYNFLSLIDLSIMCTNKFPPFIVRIVLAFGTNLDLIKISVPANNAYSAQNLTFYAQ